MLSKPWTDFWGNEGQFVGLIISSMNLNVKIAYFLFFVFFPHRGIFLSWAQVALIANKLFSCLQSILLLAASLCILNCDSHCRGSCPSSILAEFLHLSSLLHLLFLDVEVLSFGRCPASSLISNPQSQLSSHLGNKCSANSELGMPPALPWLQPFQPESIGCKLVHTHSLAREFSLESCWSWTKHYPYSTDFFLYSF